MFEKTLKIKQEETVNVKSLEYVQGICNTSTKSFRIVIIYRPPNCSTADFFLEFSDLLECLSGFGSSLFISGDFNFHIDQRESACGSRFLCFLKTVALQQHVYFPTHQSQHTLHLLITKLSDSVCSGIHIHGII